METELINKKGPWNIDYCPVNGIVITNSNENQAIAFIPAKSENAEANAILIRNAPNLLENLIRLVDRLEENGLGHLSATTRAKKCISQSIIGGN